MKKPLTVLVAFALLFLLAGCDSMMFAQYRITSVATAKEDKKKLLDSLARVASQIGLEDVTPTSKVKNTLVFYSQPKVAHFQVQLGARSIGDAIVVDLVGGFGPITPDYEKAQKALLDEMERSFRGHYDIPSPLVPIQQPNQPSEPTPPSVTDRADARSAPAGGVAHL